MYVSYNKNNNKIVYIGPKKKVGPNIRIIETNYADSMSYIENGEIVNIPESEREDKKNKIKKNKENRTIRRNIKSYNLLKLCEHSNEEIITFIEKIRTRCEDLEQNNLSEYDFSELKI